MNSLVWGVITASALLGGVLILMILLYGWGPFFLLVIAGAFLGVMIAAYVNGRDERIRREERENRG
jgi:zinc transporter ZupT